MEEFVIARAAEPPADVDRYVESWRYPGDLAATRAMWAHPGIVEAAGSFILLTYFASPGLLTVRAPGAADSLRTAVDGHRERSFLESVIGVSADDRSGGGIRNPAVRRRVEHLRDRHLDYPGMTGASMTLIAGLIAIAPLRLRVHYDQRLTARVDARYWHYITRVMRLLAADLGSRRSVDRFCGRFVDADAGLSADGADLIAGFSQRHPGHVARALPVLFPATRQVVARLLTDVGEGAWR
jgi:hypothetical protein